MDTISAMRKQTVLLTKHFLNCKQEWGTWPDLGQDTGPAVWRPFLWSCSERERATPLTWNENVLPQQFSPPAASRWITHLHASQGPRTFSALPSHLANRRGCWPFTEKASRGHTYIMHGVQKLGQLIEPLPTLPRIVGTLCHHLPQFFDVICPHFFKRSLAFEAILWNCV